MLKNWEFSFLSAVAMNGINRRDELAYKVHYKFKIAESGLSGVKKSRKDKLIIYREVELRGDTWHIEKMSR
jgi:hypothetical protein